MLKFDINLIPEPVMRLHSILGPDKSYVVGGILRDSILASNFNHQGPLTQVAGDDWDITTPLHPNEVMKRLRKNKITAVPIGIEHGTVAAVIDSVHYEITTFRYDLEYKDGRHPTVRFADSLEEDLQRRDFTVNALALDLETGEIIDQFAGIDDLRERVIRTVGDPTERFQEDYLRMLRAVRFATKLQGPIDDETFSAIQDTAKRIAHISPERIRDEIMKMLTYPTPSQGFVLMHETSLLRFVLPELDQGFGVGQNKFHADDVAMHILLTVDALSPKYPHYRFTALMHDLGKVQAKQYLPRKKDYVFYGHQYISKHAARRIMRRLRFSNKEIESTCSIVENHMYNLKPGLSEGATRRFIRRLKEENIDGYLRMRMADRKGNSLNDASYEHGIFHFMRTYRKIKRDDDALSVRNLKISGDDLIRMGLQPGPIFSQILDHLLEEVLDDPNLNQQDLLCERALIFANEFNEKGHIEFPTTTQDDSQSDRDLENDIDKDTDQDSEKPLPEVPCK